MASLLALLVLVTLAAAPTRDAYWGNSDTCSIILVADNAMRRLPSPAVISTGEVLTTRDVGSTEYAAITYSLQGQPNSVGKNERKVHTGVPPPVPKRSCLWLPAKAQEF